MSLFLKTAIKAGKAAGKIQKKYYGKVRNIRFKGNNKLNLVTEVDTLCEKTVLTILKKQFPSHNFWGEESGRGSGTSPYTWLVDPLDGTTNYAHSYPFFCCSIALIKQVSLPTNASVGARHALPLRKPQSASLNLSPSPSRGEGGRSPGEGNFNHFTTPHPNPLPQGAREILKTNHSEAQEIIAAVVYDPLSDECFSAEKGQGAFLNGKRMQVTKTSDLKQSMVCTGFAYQVLSTNYNFQNFRNFVLKSQGVRRDGSAALNLSYVAAGRFEGFWERGIQAWDMAAGVLLVQEAGGKVTDISGKPFNLFAENALASNGKIHKKMFRILKSGKDEKKWANHHHSK